MFERLKKTWAHIRRIRFKVRSGNLFRFIILAGFAPYVFAMGVLTFITAAGQQAEWWFKLIDYALKISDHIFAPATVGGVLNLVPYWDDDDGDGKSDKLEEEGKYDQRN